MRHPIETDETDRGGSPAKPLEHRLDRLLEGRLGKLILTDNRATILSIRSLGGVPERFVLRLHRSFAGAPEEVLAAVARFVLAGRQRAGRRAALAEVRAYFAFHRSSAESVAPSAPPRRSPRLQPVGVAFDLRQVRDEMNARFFAGALAVDITWGRGAGSAPNRRRRRRRGRVSTIHLGTYSFDANLVRIHRALDHPDVPRCVVEAVVYHELLHAALPPVTENGRRRLHTPELRRRERIFPELERAEAWIRRHLTELLRRV